MKKKILPVLSVIIALSIVISGFSAVGAVSVTRAPFNECCDVPRRIALDRNILQKVKPPKRILGV